MVVCQKVLLSRIVCKYILYIFHAFMGLLYNYTNGIVTGIQVVIHVYVAGYIILEWGSTELRAILPLQCHVFCGMTTQRG